MNSSITSVPLEATLTLNLISRKLSVTTLKLWQRRVAAEACLETFERQKEAKLDRDAYAYDAYKRIAVRVIQEYSHIIPYGLTAEQLCKESLISQKNPNPANITPTTIWKTMWEKMNTYIANKMIPKWNEIRPKLKDGSVPSGVQNFEPALENLRKSLFDEEFNTIFLLREKISARSSTNVSKSINKEEEDSDSEPDNDAGVDTTIIIKTATTTITSASTSSSSIILPIATTNNTSSAAATNVINKKRGIIYY